MYSTSVPDKMHIVDIIPVKDHQAIETAVNAMLKDYVYIKNHEYFRCSYNKILEAIKTVVLFVENRDITIETRTRLSKCKIIKDFSRSLITSNSSESEIGK